MAECVSDESLDNSELTELTLLDTVGYYRPHMYTSNMSMGCEGWSDDEWADYEMGSPSFGKSIVSDDEVELGAPLYDTDMSRGDELSSGGSDSTSVYMADN